VTATPTALQRAVELATIVRNQSTVAPEVQSTAIVEALVAHPVVGLIWQQAALAAALCGIVETQVAKVLANPAVLEQAAKSAAAGVPLHPSTVGLSADQVLALAGRGAGSACPPT
jgi:hypothetical protein